MDSEVGEAALASYCATVRATLFVCKGYECQEKEGVFMTAFPGPIKALEWAVTLQLALLRQVVHQHYQDRLQWAFLECSISAKPTIPRHVAEPASQCLLPTPTSCVKCQHVQVHTL